MSSIIEIADIVDLGGSNLSTTEAIFVDVKTGLVDVEPGWCAIE
jgi:hypothetical protein